MRGSPPWSSLRRAHNPDAPTQPPAQPRLLYSLSQLEEQLKAAYKLVTEGKFTEALKVRASLCPLPLPTPT